MTAVSDRLIQAAFAKLTRDHPGLSSVDRQLMDAFERLMHGRPEITDGTITVTNICHEAGVSRASYYRSPVAAVVKELMEVPTVVRLETETLKAEITRLRRAVRELRSDKAQEIRDLTEANNTYANHIQVLTLRISEVEEENNRLRAGLADDGHVTPIRP